MSIALHRSQCISAVPRPRVAARGPYLYQQSRTAMPKIPKDTLDGAQDQVRRAIVERCAVLPEVLVGERKHHHHVEDEYRCPAHRSLTHPAEEHYPEQRVSQGEEYLRLHRIEA